MTPINDEKKRDWKKYYNPEVASRASVKYAKTHKKRIPLDLNTGTDADILEHLETIDNRQGYIKRLIREDMEKGRK